MLVLGVPPTYPELPPLVFEVKNPELTYPGEECNCWAYTKNRVPELPSMVAVVPNAEPTVGAVAVEWFNGIKHVSVVKEVTAEGVHVAEANYKHCEKGERFIPFDKYSLHGFWIAG